MVWVVDVHGVALYSGCERLSFMEGWKTTFGRLLYCLPVCFSLDGIQPPPVVISSADWSRLIVLVIPFTAGLPLGNAASAKGVEAAAKEEKNPSSQCQPNGVPYFGGAHFVDTGFGKEKKGEIEYESEKGHYSCES